MSEILSFHNWYRDLWHPFTLCMRIIIWDYDFILSKIYVLISLGLLYWNISPNFPACLIIQLQCCEQQNSAMQIVCSKPGCVLASLIARRHSRSRLPRLVNWGRLIRARDLKEGMRRGLSDCSSRIWGCVWWFCNWTGLRHRTTPTPLTSPTVKRQTNIMFTFACNSAPLSSSVSCSGLTATICVKI